MPESASETLESDVKLCKAHGWGDCFLCPLEIEYTIEGCTVYLLYRDPLFEDAPLVPPGVTFFGPMAHYT